MLFWAWQRRARWYRMIPASCMLLLRWGNRPWESLVQPVPGTGRPLTRYQGSSRHRASCHAGRAINRSAGLGITGACATSLLIGSLLRCNELQLRTTGYVIWYDATQPKRRAEQPASNGWDRGRYKASVAVRNPARADIRKHYLLQSPRCSERGAARSRGANRPRI